MSNYYDEDPHYATPEQEREWESNESISALRKSLESMINEIGDLDSSMLWAENVPERAWTHLNNLIRLADESQKLI